MSLKQFWNFEIFETTVGGYVWNKTLKLFQNYFKIILLHM